MSGKLLIDAYYRDETRIAIVDKDGKLENFEIEHPDRRPIKGNIYLAKIVRIEPSIQAAFIDYGAEKHGFLPLSEIHYEYFNKNVLDVSVSEEMQTTENDEAKRPNPLHGLPRHFKIQNVISTKQVVLVQAEKEERGNKCAFFTTFISLPGRYCVLVPNPPKNKSPGVSKRLEATEKIRLREIVESIEIPDGMGCIVRTAGENCNKQEIKRDLDYLLRLWNEIKEKRVIANVSALIYEEGNVVKRSIRDLYRRTMSEIVIQGAEAYKDAKTFMKLFTPSHVKKIKLYENNLTPIFHKYDVEEKIKDILNPIVPLPSGGSIIIGVTEALTAIDVNSGKSKSERDINGTAVKTNLEAVTEVARQLKLRNIAGIIVIDFIDMIDQLSINKVERKMKEAVKQDQSNVQIGKISQFGLLELSRQRLRTGFADSSFVKCKHCFGIGNVLSPEIAALSVIRQIESFLIDGKSKSITVEVSNEIDLCILNQKRKLITEMEEKYDVSIEITRNQSIDTAECKIVVKEFRNDQSETVLQEERLPTEKSKHSKRPGRSRKSEHLETVPAKIPIEPPETIRNDEKNSTPIEHHRRECSTTETPELSNLTPEMGQIEHLDETVQEEADPIPKKKHRRRPRRRQNGKQSVVNDDGLNTEAVINNGEEQNRFPSHRDEQTKERRKADKDWWIKKLFG
ncbi:MAG: Rne/Rng family ribonuclease [Holosporales bacterium]|jgi:ribonuclease E|nr:Rne/Rng family ribonuclease [Holosporales bacterium]